MTRVIVRDSFDDLRSYHMLWLQQAARYGDVHVLLWSDDAVKVQTGQPPKFPQDERQYFVNAIRFTTDVQIVDASSGHVLPQDLQADVWVVRAQDDHPEKRAFCDQHGIEYVVVADDAQPDFRDDGADLSETGNKKVLVTGCYDWLHSGHVRFFEETSALGDLYVVAGNDENVHFLKGDKHPLFPEEERRYMVGAIRFVKQALISSGMGWLDAEPEIARIKPDIYAVNHDGDKPEKREFCDQHGIEYVVLERKPKDGLPKRESTNLRGF